MKLLRCVCAFYLLCALSIEGRTSGISVADVLEALPNLAKLKPSPIVYPGITGSIITIDGKKYNVRYYYYQSDNSQFSQNFGDFVRDNQYLNIPLKTYSSKELPIGPVLTFGSNEEDKKNQIYYMISLKDVTEIVQKGNDKDQ